MCDLVGAVLHGRGHSRGHQLVQGLQGVVDRQPVCEPGHDPCIGPLIHLAGQEQGVSPEPHPHGELQPLLLVPVEEVGPELPDVLLLNEKDIIQPCLGLGFPLSISENLGIGFQTYSLRDLTSNQKIVFPICSFYPGKNVFF